MNAWSLGARTPRPAGAFRRQLLLALSIALTVLVVELAGAWVSGSLALLADAGHVLADAGGVALALVATTLAQRPPSARRTFGWQRLEILAAAINAVLLLGVAGFVLVEGVRRLGDPPDIEPVPMLAVAVVGLVGNGVAVALLHRGQRESMNVRGAYLEVFADLLGSAASRGCRRCRAGDRLVRSRPRGVDPDRSVHPAAHGVCCVRRWKCCWRRRRAVSIGRGSSTHDRRRRGSGRA